VPSAREFTDPYLSIYRSVPRRGPGVCDVCHGAPGPGFQRCYGCNKTINQVSRPVRLVVPISLYRVGEQLHHVMWNYKNGADDAARLRHRLQVAATIARFLARHKNCLVAAAGREWNVVTIVPSTRQRAGSHPLEQVLRMIPFVHPDVATLLTAGPESIGHRKAHDQGFVTVTDVTGKHVLLVDDTFTTGGRVQSAASALQVAGARVVAALAVGRVIRPEFSAESQALWDAAGKQAFDFEVCCLETHS